jgi:hypothetical protein
MAEYSFFGLMSRKPEWLRGSPLCAITLPPAESGVLETAGIAWSEDRFAGEGVV